MTEVARQKLSASCMGRIPWNKGISHTPETKEKMRAKKIGIPLSDDHKKKIGLSNKGKNLGKHNSPHATELNRLAHLGKRASDITKQRMSKSHKGQSTWNKGIQTPLSIREKMSKGMKGIKRKEDFRKNMSGKNNIRWNGGITPLLKAIRELPEMYEWKFNVMKKDDYRDCFSGLLGSGNLETHHINPVSAILKKHNIKTIKDAIKCEELWDVNNGITMFKENHIEHHKKYKNKLLSKEFYFQKNN